MLLLHIAHIILCLFVWAHRWTQELCKNGWTFYNLVRRQTRGTRDTIRWRMNTIAQSVRGGDVALCQITLTTFYALITRTLCVYMAH